MTRKGIPRGTPDSIKQFKEKLFEVHSDRLKIVGPYVNSSTKTDFLCSGCDSVFSSTPNNALRGYKLGCAACARKSAGTNMKEAAAKTYKTNLKQLFSGKFKLVEAYRGATVKLKHRCTTCKFALYVRPNDVYNRCSLVCPKCELEKDPTSIRYRLAVGQTLEQALTEVHPTLRFSKVGSTLMKPCEFTCTVCNTFQKRTTANVLTVAPCNECGARAKSEKLRHNHADYVRCVKEIYGAKLQVIGTYRDRQKRLRHKCMTCFNTWKQTPANILQSRIACPKCVFGVRKKNIAKGCKVKVHQFGDREVRVQGYEPQALTYLVDVAGFEHDDIVVESEGDVPVIDYRSRKRHHRYFPDIYVKSVNAIFEVKSEYTLGLGTSRRHKGYWYKNCLKAEAVHAAGYKFAVLLMDTKGRRIRLPKYWMRMPLAQVMAEVKRTKEEMKRVYVK